MVFSVSCFFSDNCKCLSDTENGFTLSILTISAQTLIIQSFRPNRGKSNDTLLASFSLYPYIAYLSRSAQTFQRTCPLSPQSESKVTHNISNKIALFDIFVFWYVTYHISITYNYKKVCNLIKSKIWVFIFFNKVLYINELRKNQK